MYQPEPFRVIQLNPSGIHLNHGALMKRRLSVLLVLVSLLSGCGGGRTFDSIKKMAPVVLLVGLAAFTSQARDQSLSRSPTR